MEELSEFCRNLKKDFKPKIQDFDKPVRFWSEKDVIDKKIIDAFVIILRTKGCSWALESGCTMCGYFNDSAWEDIQDENVLKQFDTAMSNYKDQKFVKIFTSGSFLDDKEVTPNVRNKILSNLSEKTDKISVESRPEYITDKKLKQIKNITGSKTFEIGVGLETSNDTVRKNAINKGFTFNDYKKASNTIKRNNSKLKTYVLIKPPFLTEKEAIDDCINTVEKIKKTTDTVSFNPTNVQRNTLVNFLWKRQMFRPAWLWSVVEILKQSKTSAKNLFIKCDIAGGGNRRGAHNCGLCDSSFLKAISDFSLKQDTKVFEKLDCKCHEKWLDQLEIEKLSFGSIVDV